MPDKDLSAYVFGIEELEVEEKILTAKEEEEKIVSRGRKLDEMVSSAGFKILYEKMTNSMSSIQKKIFSGVGADSVENVNYYREILIQKYGIYNDLMNWLSSQIEEGNKIKEEWEKREDDSE